MEAGRYIEAPRSVRLAVAKELGMTEAGMSHAMNFKRHGEKSAEARARVLQSPEAKIMRYVPECETIFLHDGTMHQTFDNGYLLVVEMKSGTYRVYRDNTEERGKELLSGHIQLLEDLEEIQKLVEGLSRK